MSAEQVTIETVPNGEILEEWIRHDRIQRAARGRPDCSYRVGPDDFVTIAMRTNAPVQRSFTPNETRCSLVLHSNGGQAIVYASAGVAPGQIETETYSPAQETP
jgi:hypothetical protein